MLGPSLASPATDQVRCSQLRLAQPDVHKKHLVKDNFLIELEILPNNMYRIRYKGAFGQWTNPAQGNALAAQIHARTYFHQCLRNIVLPPGTLSQNEP
jgi:hypothetical protein